MSDGHDLVVKSVHHGESPLHTPLDWRLVLECPAPLLLVSNQRNQEHSGNVLAGVDLRRQDVDHHALNLKVLDAASHIANLVDSAMHCVYVVEVSDPLRDIDVGAMHTKAVIACHSSFAGLGKLKLDPSVNKRFASQTC